MLTTKRAAHSQPLWAASAASIHSKANPLPESLKNRI